MGTERRSQETQEEELHDPQEDQAQAQEGEAGRVEVLQGGRQREDQPSETRVQRRGVRSRSLHGRSLRPPVLRQVRPHLRLQQARGQISCKLSCVEAPMKYFLNISPTLCCTK